MQYYVGPTSTRTLDSSRQDKNSQLDVSHCHCLTALANVFANALLVTRNEYNFSHQQPSLDCVARGRQSGIMRREHANGSRFRSVVSVHKGDRKRLNNHCTNIKTYHLQDTCDYDLMSTRYILNKCSNFHTLKLVATITFKLPLV